MTPIVDVQNSKTTANQSTLLESLCATAWALAGTLVLIALIFFASAKAAAGSATQTLTGQLVKQGDDAPLKMEIKSRGIIANIETTTNITAILRRLRNNDLMTVQGNFSSDGKTVYIDSIDRLGLQELLGAWRTSRWEVFEFKSYSQLDLFIPNSLSPNKAASSLSEEEPSGSPRMKTVSYAITTDSADGFSIFMSDDNGVRMGFLTISPELDSLSIAIPDPQSGEISETISLVPVRFK